MGMTADGLSHWQAETEGTDLLEMTIGDLLDRRADELSTQEAIVYSCYPEFGDALAIRWTYQDYRDRANAVAKGLLAQGLAKGDHIAVWAANLPEWPILMMAAAKVGLVLVTINPVLQATEVEYLLKQGDVQALFFMARVRTSDHLATIRSLIIPGGRPGEVTSERLPRLRFVCLMGMPPTGLREQEGWRPALLGEVAASGLQVSEAELAAQQTAVTPLDPAMLLYTSGTTGSPKGVVLTHRGLLNNTLFVTRRWGMEQTDRFCLPVPFFHAKGVGSILKTLAAGATLHPLLAFDPQKVLQVISQERCTMFAGVPTMLVALMQHPDFTTADLSSLKQAVSGGAPVPVALMEQVKECTRADVGISFGQTESLVITQTLPDDPFERKAATMPEKTAEAIDAERWLHTGDLATMDGRGYVNIVGRLKDMVIRGGENLFPREIEEFLMRHPKVAGVQVVGVPDAFFGEELLAVVIPKVGEQLTEQELRDYCKGQISHQKIPRYFQFVESYPLTASGKVQKFVLREQAIKALGLEAAANTQTA